jgi:hypothetical protein
MAQVNAGRVRFVSRGTYNESTQYYLFDLVDYEGSSYVAITNTLGNLPTNTTYWQLVASKGNTRKYSEQLVQLEMELLVLKKLELLD